MIKLIAKKVQIGSCCSFIIKMIAHSMNVGADETLIASYFSVFRHFLVEIVPGYSYSPLSMVALIGK